MNAFRLSCLQCILTTQRKLLVNIKETHIMIFRKGGTLANMQFKYGNNKVETVSRFVYLGIVFVYRNAKKYISWSGTTRYF